MIHGRFAGLCAPLSDRLHFSSEPGYSDVVAIIADPRVNVGTESVILGRGSTLDRSRSRAAALAEAFERYSLHMVEPARLSHHSAHALEAEGTPFLSPHELASFVDVQYQSPSFGLSRPPAHDEVTPWLTGIDLCTGADVLVPAEVCMFAAAGRRPRKTRSGAWYPPTSNGTATATNPFVAALSGLYELLERDAFLLAWHHRRKLCSLMIGQDDSMMDEVNAIVHPARLRFQLVDLSEVHEVPSVLAITWRTVGDHPVFGFGAAAGPDLRAVSIKALAESASCFDYVYRRFQSGDLKRLELDDVKGFDDHPEFYFSPDRHHLLEFLLRPEQVRPLPSAATSPMKPSLELSRLARKLALNEIRAYAVDITPVEGEALGLVTYKVVSPDLVPLNASHHQRHLGHPRLLTEPVRLGWRLETPTLDDISHDPHPFP